MIPICDSLTRNSANGLKCLGYFVFVQTTTAAALFARRCLCHFVGRVDEKHRTIVARDDIKQNNAVWRVECGACFFALTPTLGNCIKDNCATKTEIEDSSGGDTSGAI